MDLSDLFAPLGRIIINRETTYWPFPREILLQLHRLGHVYELDAAPADCIHIDSVRFGLYCYVKDIVRFPIQILTLPVMNWCGRGKYRRKAIETIELIVDVDLIESADIDVFCSAAQKGWAYEGASKRRKRSASAF